MPSLSTFYDLASVSRFWNPAIGQTFAQAQKEFSQPMQDLSKSAFTDVDDAFDLDDLDNPANDDADPIDGSKPLYNEKEFKALDAPSAPSNNSAVSHYPAYKEGSSKSDANKSTSAETKTTAADAKTATVSDTENPSENGLNSRDDANDPEGVEGPQDSEGAEDVEGPDDAEGFDASEGSKDAEAVDAPEGSDNDQSVEYSQDVAGPGRVENDNSVNNEGSAVDNINNVDAGANQNMQPGLGESNQAEELSDNVEPVSQPEAVASVTEEGNSVSGSFTPMTDGTSNPFSSSASSMGAVSSFSNPAPSAVPAVAPASSSFGSDDSGGGDED